MRTAHQQLRTLLDADTPDPAAVGTQAIAIDQARDEMRVAWERFETDFTATLTETQRAIYQALREGATIAAPSAGIVARVDRAAPAVPADSASETDRQA